MKKNKDIIIFSCKRCQANIEADNSRAGRAMKCPSCNRQVLVPKNTKLEGKASEFKRTCKRCSHVWYSLKAREDKLLNDICCNQVCFCTYCSLDCCADPKRFFKKSYTNEMGQWGRRNDAIDMEREKLFQCPNCNSRNYDEVLQNYYKKKISDDGSKGC